MYLANGLENYRNSFILFQNYKGWAFR